MKLKRAFVMVGVALAALALAATSIQGAKGHGVAVNENGIRGQFEFDVKKVHHNDRTEIGGPFHFRAADTAHHRGVEIVMPRARLFAKDGNVAEFGGPARAVFVEGDHRIVREGALRVRVADRRNHDHPEGDPDLLGLRFATEHDVFVFEFAGRVTEGDIIVYERNE